MKIIDLFKNRDRRSKAELRGVIARLEQHNTELNKENGKLQASIDKKNEAIDQLNRELHNVMNDGTKRQFAWQKILREKRDEISRLKRDLQAANGMIDAMREDRPQRGANGRFIKREK